MTTDDPACVMEDNILLVVGITFLIVFSLNIAIFTKIILFQRFNGQSGKQRSSNERRNIILFVQTVLQDSLYIIDLTFTFKLSALLNTRMWAFISGTFVWESLHAFDGFIMCLFNEKLSIIKHILRFYPSPRVSEIARTTPSTTLARVE
ncbi:hypothetical protein GCK72_018056 [Caenorhabditis remanei]|uniref:7TM GPCR serpentine receptor class x (Srx) domain-containing protein n=1 Tax=Caenorhabditis remanei TaxID=31234 RepID=A0A6A5GAD4_CAERE|nr:hypothetical protein GCK72_018056 [Caenorhabditis remanei]KAF1751502.1 hypothetical protein GCK72_018056 [Caenorhabditis remanei]